ncbi:MAG: Fpg/Nei family DNA glycosylase, partial [Candidatus Thorarchaeota archaeon]
MFGKLDLSESIETFLNKKKLGPDALKMTFEEFQTTLKKRKAIVKSALMNQSIVAGIGNIYSDEILFQTHIHPKTKINDVPEQELEFLYNNIKKVLNYGIKMKGDYENYSRDFLIPNRTKDGICPNCTNPLERYELQGRHGFFCKYCQK